LGNAAPLEEEKSMRTTTSIVGPAVWVLGFAMVAFVIGGCNGGTEPSDGGAAGEAASDAHDHGDHEGHGDHADHGDHAEHGGHGDHEMGAHGGHLLHLDPGGAHAEWVHLDQENEIQVFLDPSLLPAEAVEMHVVIGDAEQDPFALEEAIDRLGPGGYRLISEPLLTHIKMSAGEGVDVRLVVTRAGGTFTSPIEHHEH
jgi:hypothetical protein